MSGTVDVGQGGNTITNTTTPATADQPDPSTVGDDLVESVTVNDAVDLLTLKALSSGDPTPAEGDTVTFEIVVVNNGGGTATNVSLTDTLPVGITYTADTTSQGSYDPATGLFTIGTLNVGDTALLTLTGTVDAGQGGNTITNVTTAATGDQMDPSMVGDDLTEAVVIDNTTDLVTVKTLASGNAIPEEGDSVTFDITVTNSGPITATNVSLTDLLPAGITYTADSTTQGNYDPTTGLFDIGTLNVGDTATLTLTGTVDAGQGGNTIINTTTAATGDQVDSSTAGDDLNEAVDVNVFLDKDWDGIVDSRDADADGDGILDSDEQLHVDQVTLAALGNQNATVGTPLDAFSGGGVDAELTVTSGSPIRFGFSNDIADVNNGPLGPGFQYVGSAPDATFELDLSGPVSNLSFTIGDMESSLETTVIRAYDENGNLLPDSALSFLISADATSVSILSPNSVGTSNSGNGNINFDNDAGTVQVSVDGIVSRLEFDVSSSGGTIGITFANYNYDVPLDTDGDGNYNHCDIDSDNDGISDLLESGNALAIAADTDGSGVIDNAEAAAAGFTDADGDGAWDQLSAAPVDTDTDGIADFLDLDSDNDGIADAIEAQPTVGYQAPSIGSDADGDGAVDTFDDPSVVHGAAFTTPEDTDGDGTFDFLDTDSDNDGLSDTVESGLTPGADNDGDGIADNIAPNSYADPDGIVNDPTTDLANETGDTSEVGYREVVVEADLVTVKTLLSGDITPDEGDIVTFDITVTNNGGDQATNVSLIDTLPAGITFTGSTTTPGTTYDQTTGLFDIGTLNVGDTATLTLTGTVDVGQGGNTITNTTTAAMGDQNDPSMVGDDLIEAVTVNDAADLVTVKTLASGDATPAEGDTVTFQIEITNNGGAQATNVSLIDSLPTGITYTADTTSQGSYDPTTGVFTIGTIDVGDSAIITLSGTVDAGQAGNTITNVTTAATGDQMDPSMVGDDLDEAVIIDNTTDLVTVKTLASGDATPDEGDTVTFDITVTNSGPITATNVSLTDLLPAGITYTADSTTQGIYDSATGLFDIGTLTVGQTATLTLSGTVDVGQGGNTITNVTTAATGDQADPSMVGDDLVEAVTVNDAADLVTVKTLASGDSTPAEGDTVTFQITVTNNGAAQATNVSLTDTLPAGITYTADTTSQGSYDPTTGLFTIGTLDVGDTAIITLSGTVDVGEGGNTITNVTTAATGDQPDPSIVGDDLDETVNVEEQANLITVKTLASGNNTPNEGEVVTFDITVTNDGPNTATNVSLTDLLPAGLTATVNNGGITQGSYDAVTGLFDIGTLANGASATLTLEGTVDVGAGGTTITNVTTAAAGDQLDPTTVGDDLTESVGSINDADLVTVKRLAIGSSTPDEGDTVIFEILVTNNGGAQATNVSLIDSLPPGLTLTGSSTTQGSYDIATGLFDIGTLNVGQSAALILEGTVDVGQGGNTITNITTAATGDQPDPSTAGDDLEEAVTVNDAADLVTVKTLASGDATPAEGDTVTFQIEITNNGGAQATNVSLVDTLPAGITYTADTTSQGSYDPTTGLFTIGTLDVGDSAIITLSGTVDAGQAGNTITNVTTAATGDQMDPSMVGDDLDEAVIVDNTTNLVTVKTLASGDSTPEEGDTVTFDITVSNSGPITATNVSLTDLLPAGLTATGNNGGITQGSYDPVTGLFDIGTLLVGQTATLTLEGIVDAGQGGNTITNVTTAAVGDQMDSDTIGDDLDESVAVGIPAADLVTVKTLASGDATPDEGDTVIFDITITNNGPDTATGISLTDSLPAGLTFVADTVSQGSYDPTTGLFDIGTLASGATATLTLEGTVDVGQGGNTITNITTAATGDQVDPSMVGDDLIETVVVNDAADLVTVKTLASGDATPAEGDIVTFQIEVTNNGGAQATNVSLTDSLPAGITYTADTTSQGSYDPATGLFTIGTLDVGDTAIITLSGTVDAGQGGNTITNITTAATGDQMDPSMVGDDLEESVDVIDNTTNLVTVKTLASGDTTPDEGDTVTFDITVTNSGPITATNVSLTDLLPAGLTATGNNGGITQGSYDAITGLFDIGTLNVGQTATLTLEGIVDAGQAGNTITNVTTAATGDQNDPDTIGDDLEESVIVGIPAADLVTVKTLASGDATPDEGDTVTFQIEVTNNGPDTATNVSLIDQLPAGLTYVSDTGAGVYDPVIGLWTIGTLASGTTATITISATVDVGEGGNTITNITTAATGDQPDPSTVGDDLVETGVINDAADLVTVKTLASGDATPAEGDTVVFQIEVTNGGAAQATNVSLTDALPAGLTYVSDTSAGGTYDPTTGLWTIGTLDVGDTATITISATVDAGQAGNTITNVTTAATGDQMDPSMVGDDLDEAIVVEDNTTDLVTVKTLASGDTTPDEGDTVSFDITVTNNGPITATNVSLTDLLPAGITFNQSSVTQGSYDSATGLFDIGTLANGATATLTLEGTVDAGQAGNTITNITTAATGDQVDPGTVGDDLDESVIVGISAADLVTVKTLASGDATPDEGDTVTFQIEVTNNGPDTATNVSLIDQLPAGLTYVSDTGAGGVYDPVTGLWTIGSLASGATATITISATVDVGESGNTITNITTAATGDQPDPSTAGDDLVESVVVNDAADLVTVKTLVSGDSTPAEGDLVTYEITVTNNGGAQATNVSLTDLLPPGLTATAINGSNTVTAQPSYAVEVTNGTFTDFFATPLWFGLHDGTFDLFDSGSQASSPLEIIAELGDASALIADFEAAPGSPGDINGLVFGGATGVPPISPGETGIGSFNIINPAAYQYFSFASMVIPTNDTFIGNDSATAYQIFDSAGNFLGTNGVFEIQVTDIYDAGTEVNDASATGGAAFIPGVDELLGADENGVVSLATNLSEFQGLVTPNGFTINDTTLGAGESFATIRIVEIPGGAAYDAATGLWSIGTLGVGETVTLTIEGTVDAGQGGNTITNVTTAATGDQMDPSMAGDDLDETIVVEDNTTDLVTVKTLASGDTTPDEGDTVAFEITVTNSGPGNATNVSLTDLLPAGITFNQSSVTQGSYDSATGLFDIGALANGATATLTLEGTVDAGQAGNTITNMTTAATGDQVDPSTAGDDLDESVVVGIPAADLVTVKTLASGDATPDEGDTVTFQIEVTNNGPDAATNVSLIDQLPAGLTYVSDTGAGGVYDPVTGLWSIGTLASGATATITISATVNVGEGGNTITNITTAATGDQPDPSTAGDDLVESVVVNDAVDLVTLKALASGNATPAVGDTVTFEIVVVNNGGGQATNVSLTDSLPAGISFTGSTVSQGSYDETTGVFDIGTLNVGDVATLSLTGTVDAGQGGNTITNVTTAATGDQMDPSTVGDDLDASVDVVDNTTDLVTVKTLASGDTTPDEGDTVAFEITVTNSGPGNATNVSLTDLLPAGITYTQSSVTQGSYDSATGLFDIGALANGATATLTLEGTVDVGQSGNTITNITTAATGDQVDPSTAGDDLDESVIVGIPAADLVTVKTLASGDATPDEGDTVTFQIEVTNNGPDAATNVSLIDQLPAGLTYVSDTGAGGVYDPVTGLWSIGTLASGATATITISATVNVGEGGNTITNITTAATGDQPDPSTAGDDLVESVVVNDAADLVTVKTLASGDATPAEGDTVTFQIEVTNNGGAQATNVSLIDALPAGLTYVGDTGAGGTYDPTTGLWSIGTLNVGDTATITISATVDAGQGGNTITNITTAATGDQMDPSTAGDDLDESVIIDNTTDLVTVKTLASGDATPSEGDIVTFLIEVTNNGTAQATNVSLTDLLPAGLTPTANNGTGGLGGTYDPTTGLWTIGTLNVGDTATLILEGTVDVGQAGMTITNFTTAATGDQPDPTNAGDDLVESVDVNTLIFAEIGAAKQLVGSPIQLANGNFEANYLVSVENTGSVDLANLTLTENLATQFGGAFVDVRGLAIVTGPTGASAIALDSANFDGRTNTQIVDTTQFSRLAVGDSFIFEFTVEIDATQAMGVLENTVVATGDAVDASNNQLTDLAGNPIVVVDSSDSGANPANNNPGEPGDTGSPDDPTPLYIPSLGLAKQAGDAVPNGENFDVTFTVLVVNNGNVSLNDLTINDDILAQFGAPAIGVSNLTVSNFSGTGFAPTANTIWESDTTQSLVSGGQVNVGDSFEVSYTVTIDPDISGDSVHLVNQAVGNGIAIGANGGQLFDSAGNLLTATDVSDNGVDANAENNEASPDGVFANDPTPVQIADLGVAKSVVSGPQSVNGNFLVTFAATVENTGTVDLENLRLTEDLASQFGSLFVDARSVTLVSGTTNPSSSISLSNSFNGSSNVELLDQSVNNILHVGDSFTFEFVVEVDGAAAGQQLDNHIIATADAIDEAGNPVLNLQGGLVTASDVSDSGFSPNTGNAGQPDDNGTTEDPTTIGFPLFDVPVDDDGTTSGNPPTLIGIPPLVVNSISNFIGSPGPIYSGIPTNTTNPVTLESSRPITGGYSLDAAVPGDGSIQMVECCEVVDAVPGQPVVVEVLPTEILEGDCGCAPGNGAPMIQEVPMEVPCEGEVQPCGECQAPMDECGCGGQVPMEGGFVPIPTNVRGPSFLQRMRNWL